jgi:hypothetical protein
MVHRASFSADSGTLPDRTESAGFRRRQPRVGTTGEKRLWLKHRVIVHATVDNQVAVTTLGCSCSTYLLLRFAILVLSREISSLPAGVDLTAFPTTISLAVSVLS